jgi:hypothetical protein
MLFPGIIFAIFGVAFSIWTIMSIYFVFIKRKDEYEKMIATKSMTQSFTVIFIIYLVYSILDFAFYVHFKSKIVQGIELGPFLPIVIILNIIVSINKLRYTARTNRGNSK